MMDDNFSDKEEGILFLIKIIDKNYESLSNKIKEDLSPMFFDNMYALSPKLYFKIIKEEINNFYEFLKSKNNDIAASRGRQVSLLGLNESIILSFFNMFQNLLLQLSLKEKQSILVSIYKIIQMYTTSYLLSFIREQYIQKNIQQEKLHDSKNEEIAELKEKIIKSLAEENKRIQDENIRRIDFMINTGHELKNPLTLLNNALNELKIEIGNRFYKNIPLVDTQIQIINKMISTIFDYDKILQGKIIFKHNTILNISKIINEKIELYTPIAEKDGIQIKSEITDNLYVKIHPQALNSIIDNLLDNSLKYNKKNGSVFITVKDKEGFVNLIIKDTGIGINKEDQEHIFKPFFQSNHKKNKPLGLGMGLAFIKQIIKLLPSSKITFASEEGKGSVFTVTFKKETIKKGQKEKLFTQIEVTKPIYRKKAIINKTIGHDENKKTIMIIDDNEELLSLLQANMGERFNVYVFTDGVEALRVLPILPRPDVILLDILMQPVDGYQFLEQFKKIDSMNDIYVIFLTAKNNKIDILNGLRSGAIDYICKPLNNVDELNEKIQAILRFKDILTENITKQIKKNLDNAFDLSHNMEEIIKKRFNQLAYKYRLSDQQTKIMWYVKDNMSDKEIAKILCISSKTVGTHVQDIRIKCNMKTKQKLIQLFREALTI